MIVNKIVIGSDHGGFEYKEIIKNHLLALEYEVLDVGCFDKSSIDYPDIALKLCEIVNRDKIKGILVCGTGIGIGIAANKCPGIRAALCHDEYSARMARLHNDSNVLTLGQRVVGEGLMLSIVDTWLDSKFEGGRHENRVNKIIKMEGEK
ncbi:ribose 5-phosphate isomerase B [Erysipelotrichaceae bacterium OttesenSCG-928-M19]|nr:ribose 5-phosphate isomerase B [Erysipelotrichaceae bacterium OttesenSCG-928-M19]